ncbi:hypothetical protein WA026_016075 [Henosepilachna vigintioctopunctata]|uniref:Profilin n=1 Tax=Henosepilachna vigintioctopunctata TaxID=420089 RepID=A0AAW1TZM1_9CUCU
MCLSLGKFFYNFLLLMKTKIFVSFQSYVIVHNHTTLIDMNKNSQFEPFRVDDSFSGSFNKGGGSAIIVRNGIKYVKKENINELSVKSHIEMASIEIPTFNLVVISICRLPSGNIHTFISRFEEALSLLDG